MKTFYFSLLLFLSISSSAQKKISNELLKIDLKKVLLEQSDIPVSQFVDGLEYIPLEITSESALSPGFRLQITDENIIVCNYTRGGISLNVFEKSTGKFIRKIGRQGRGPEEFLRPLDNFYNPYDKKIYALGEQSVKIYNLEGSYFGSFEKPKVDGYSQSINSFIGKETYICYAGSFTTRLAVSTRSTVIKRFPQYEKWSDGDVKINQSPLFFSFNNNVSFKEKSNDTVFYVSSENLTPRFILYSGDSRYPFTLTRKEALEQMTKPAGSFETLNLFENQKFLFFDIVTGYDPESSEPIHNFCILDKTNNKVKACMNYHSNPGSGLSDDINNFLQITPVTITDKNELVAILQPEDIIKWKKANPASLAKLSAKLKWLDKIGEFDNPVIVIGKCKN